MAPLFFSHPRRHLPFINLLVVNFDTLPVTAE